MPKLLTNIVNISIFADGQKQLIKGKRFWLNFPMTKEMTNILAMKKNTQVSC